MAQPNKKNKCGKIAAVVRKKAAAGVSVREIFASIQNYQNAPGSMTTFYKYYQDDMDAARGEVTEVIGSKIIEQAKQGDYKSQELWLTTKGGWSKQNTQTNVDIGPSEDDKNSALETLLSKLGMKDEE